MGNNNNSNNSGVRKQYSFLHIVEASRTAPNGAAEAFKHVTVSGVLTKFEQKVRASDNTTFWVASLPLNNRAKAINRALGTNFPEDQETVWASVTFRWPQVADRLNKVRGEQRNVRCTVVGAISVRSYQDRSGNYQNQVQIQVEDFDLAPRARDGQQAYGQQAYGQQQASGQQGYGQPQPAPRPSVAQTGAFTELDDEDGELPF